MPITYHHRVPASSLGKLSLMAGQEQYEAQRGREERAASLQVAMQAQQQAQQRAMQDQRLAYDAAATQYRNAADYGKFMMGAQLNQFNRGQDQQNRVDLANLQNDNFQGRQDAQWDRAAGQAQQQDTFNAWEGFVNDVMPTINQDGRDLLNGAQAKYRSIQANPNFDQDQKKAATNQLLEQTQALGLAENHAVEQMYEAGKKYHGDDGWGFHTTANGDKVRGGQHYDGLEKPEGMDEADWMDHGRDMAWAQKYKIGTVGRDTNGRARYMVPDGNGGEMEMLFEDEKFDNEQRRVRRVEGQEAHDTRMKGWRTEHAKAVDTYMDNFNTASPLSEMAGPGGDFMTASEKQAEFERRMEAAKDHANGLYPRPKLLVDPDDLNEQDQAILNMQDDELAADPGLADRNNQLRRATGQDIPDRTPLDDPNEGVADAGQEGGLAGSMLGVMSMGADLSNLGTGGSDLQTQAGPLGQVARMIGVVADPQAQMASNEALEVMRQLQETGEDPSPEQMIILQSATARLNRMSNMGEQSERWGSSVSSSPFGLGHQRRLQRQQALNAGRAAGGTGEVPLRPSEVRLRDTGTSDDGVTPDQRAEIDMARARAQENLPRGAGPAEAEGGYGRGLLSESRQLQAAQEGKWRPKGEGLVGAAAPPPLTEEEEHARDYRSPSQVEEMGASEKRMHYATKPETARDAIFKDMPAEAGSDPLWAKGDTDFSDEKIDAIYDALDHWGLHHRMGLRGSKMTRDRFGDQLKQSSPGKLNRLRELYDLGVNAATVDA